MHQPSLVVGGRVLMGEELREYAQRNGLCPICGIYQIYEKKGPFLRPRFEPLTRRNKDGAFVVYKGYCLAPTCYTLSSAMKLLGEIPQRQPVPSYQDSPDAVQGPNSYWGNTQGGQGVFQPTSGISYAPRINDFSYPRGSIAVTRNVGDHHGGATGGARRPTFLYPQSLQEEQPSRKLTDHDCPNESLATNSANTPPAETNSMSSGSLERRLPSAGNISDFNQSPDGISKPADMLSRRTILGIGTNITLPITPETTEPSGPAQDPLIKELQEKIQERNYLEFINLLDHQQREEHVLLEGFRLLREHVVAEHRARPDCVIFGGDNWVKAINDSIDRPERDVVLSALVTLLTMSRQGMPYRRSMIRKGAIDRILGLVDKRFDDEEVMDAISSIVVSLSLKENGCINAKSYPKIASLIRKLASIISSEQHCGKGMALRGLFHISNQRKKSDATGKDALHDVRNALGSEPFVQAIINVIRHDRASSCVVEAGMFLLWKICTPIEHDEETMLGGTDRNIADLCKILETASTEEVVGPCLGLLGNFATTSAFTVTIAHQAIARICELLLVPELRTPAIANVASHALCNLVDITGGNPGESNPQTIIDTVVGLLLGFSTDEEVAECCCWTLNRASKSVVMKQYLATSAVFNVVRSTFENFVILQSIEPSSEVEDACLYFFALISGLTSGAKLLVESELSNQLHWMMSSECDDYTLGLVDIISSNIVQCKEKGGANFGVLSQQPARFVELLRNAIAEDDTAKVIAELYECGDAGLSGLADRGLDELLSAMNRFGYSTKVLLEGSQLLAFAISRLPHQNIDSAVSLSDDYVARLCKKQVVEVLCDAIVSHVESIDIQIGCMSALSNLFLPFCTAYRSAPTLADVQSWIGSVSNHVLKALGSNEGNLKLQESGFHLCLILARVSSEGQLSSWAMSLLPHIFDSMTRFKTAERLNILACEILLQLQTNQDCLDFIGNSTSTSSLLHFLSGDMVELVLPAAALLSTLAVKDIGFMYRLLENPSMTTQLITCLRSHAAGDHIPCHVAMILEAVIKVEGVRTRLDFVDNGVLQALMNAIEGQPSNTMLCKHAAQAVTVLVSCVDDTTLASLADAVDQVYIPQLNTHVDGPECEAALLDLIWSFASRIPSVTSMLVDMDHLQKIVSAMNLHVESEYLQRSGCRMLRLLIGFGDGKRLVGAVGGIPAILNAILAHGHSPAIQQEALAGLKSLATDSANKPILAEHNCVRTVTLSLWINYRDPEVILSALSALNNLAVDSRTRSVAPVPAEILDIIASAMHRFPYNEILQKSACFYLKNCTYLPENLILMNQSADMLIAVLLKASEYFPQSCQVLAHGILRKIQVDVGR